MTSLRRLPCATLVILAALFPVLIVARPAKADPALDPASRVTPQADRPSCRSISYAGSAGKIDVQTTDSDQGPVVSWAITMYDESESVGRLDVDTYLNGKKTTSGFHRTTGTPYVPTVRSWLAPGSASTLRPRCSPPAGAATTT